MDGFQGWAGVVATLLPDKGDRISGPHLSYYKATFQGAENAGKLEPEASVAPTPHRACTCTQKWIARSRVRIQLEEKFFAFISNPAVMIRRSEDVPILAQWNLIQHWMETLYRCLLALLFNVCIVVMCSFHFRNITRKKSYIFKKTVSCVIKLQDTGV